MLRRMIPELMDDPAVDAQAHTAALRSLNAANRALGFDRRLAREILSLGGGRMGRVLEIGVGGGGLMKSLLYCDGASPQLRAVGLDRSPRALAMTRRNCNLCKGVRLIAGDALHLPFRDGAFDVAVCSLLLHHFEQDAASRLLSEAARVSRRVLVCDLNRSTTAWTLTWLFVHATSRSRVFRTDGPRSVRAAYIPAEARELARRAGVHVVRFKRMFPFRWLMDASSLE